jgi:hypothetical protein
VQQTCLHCPEKEKICYPDIEAEIEHSVTYVYSTEPLNIDTQNQAFVEEYCFISRKPGREQCRQLLLVSRVRLEHRGKTLQMKPEYGHQIWLEEVLNILTEPACKADIPRSNELSILTRNI